MMKLRDYIKGERKGKDARRLEREAMEDPFLADAIEGFDSVEGDHQEAFERLSARLGQRVGQARGVSGTVGHVSASARRRPVWHRPAVWASVAAILVCGVLSGLLYRNSSRSVVPDNNLAVTESLPSFTPSDVHGLDEKAVVSQDDTLSIEDTGKSGISGNKPEVVITLSQPILEPTVIELPEFADVDMISDALVIVEEVVSADSSGDGTQVVIAMNEDQKPHEEVVVVGYGTVSKRDLTGSVSQSQPPALEEALAGRVAGLTVESPQNDKSNVRIRGQKPSVEMNAPAEVEEKEVQKFGGFAKQSKAVKLAGTSSLSAELGLPGASLKAYPAGSGLVSAAQNPVTYFGLNVGNGSYLKIRDIINHGGRPRPDDVRVEEMINYFSYGYPAPSHENPVRVTAEVGPCPWSPGNRLIFISVKTYSSSSEDTSNSFDVLMSAKINHPSVVSYRVVGYESSVGSPLPLNVAKLPAGHSVVSLYEIAPAGVGELMAITVDYRDSSGDAVKKATCAVTDFGREPSEDFYFAAAVAMYGQLLREPDNVESAAYDLVVATARKGLGRDITGERREFIRIVEISRP